MVIWSDGEMYKFDDPWLLIANNNNLAVATYIQQLESPEINKAWYELTTFPNVA